MDIQNLIKLAHQADLEGNYKVADKLTERAIREAIFGPRRTPGTSFGGGRPSGFGGGAGDGAAAGGGGSFGGGRRPSVGARGRERNLLAKAVGAFILPSSQTGGPKSTACERVDSGAVKRGRL